MNENEKYFEIDNENKEIDYISADVHLDMNNKISSRKKYVIIAILFMINLLNYIDRYTIAGVLDEIISFYGLDNKQAGILQTAFIVVYMIMSPIFGYLGDRFSRKKLILVGVLFWSVTAFASSFIPNNMFTLFVVMRALIGVGEASYCTVAPTMISDLYTSDQRTKMMTFFYFAIPVGSGLGYIIGYILYLLFKKWQYALWFSPILGLICIILLFFFVDEPIRGAAEGGSHLKTSPWIEDILQLTRNRSFILLSFGFTCASFVLGSMSWWAVIYFNYSIDAFYEQKDASKTYNITLIFGALVAVAGIIGVFLGTESARRLHKYCPNADAIVCAFGLIVAGPVIFLVLLLSKNNLNWSLGLTFFGLILLCLNWALVTDMTMSVVIPTRRATALAYQMILIHAFGDAGSPYIVGAISDEINSQFKKSYSNITANYIGLQYAFYINPFMVVLGGGIFLWASLYLIQDKIRVKDDIEKSKSCDTATVQTNSDNADIPNVTSSPSHMYSNA